MEEVYVKTRAEWRKWLAKNHNISLSGIWLVYYKKGSSNPSLEYEESVEEALCYGWIDSIIKKIDAESYVRKFTPRKKGSKWSATNKKRVTRLLKKGKMTEFGQQMIDEAKLSGMWDVDPRPDFALEVSELFAAELDKNFKAKSFFYGLAPGYQKQFIGWINSAKRDATKENRVKESIDLLARGQKLGLK